MKLTELTERQRKAAIATALDESIQNPRATEIRKELAEFDFSVLSSADFRSAAGAHAAVKMGKRKRSPFFTPAD